MTTDLDNRITRALADAAAALPEPADGLAAVIGARRPTRNRPLRVGAAALAATAVVVAGGVVIARGDRSAPPVLATTGLPAAGETTWDCGNVSYRQPDERERALVTPAADAAVPGYRLVSGPTVSVQERAPSDPACWGAGAVYADPVTGRLLVATVAQVHVYREAPCILPEGYRPATCTSVRGRPASRTNEGTRSEIQWTTDGGAAAVVSAYGLTPAELDAAAESFTFDGTTVSIQPPTGMTLVAEQPRERSDGIEVTTSFWTYRNGDGAEVYVTIRSGATSVYNLVGPAELIRLGAGEALVVTTGGPDTGILQWTGNVDEQDATSAPAGAYVTWTADGRTYRIDGPDAGTVRAFADVIVEAAAA